MASFILHGLWVQQSGLHLWVEQVDGHRIVLPEVVPEGTFPPAIEAHLQSLNFFNRLKTTLRTPKGREVKLTIPTAGLTLADAVQFLGHVLSTSQEDTDATPEQKESIAPDLRWLGHMYGGISNFVDAGRVSLKVLYIDAQWWPQFQLFGGPDEHRWLAEMMGVAPGILTVNNGNLAEDIVDSLTHWVAVAKLRDFADAGQTRPWHDFSNALLYSQSVRFGGKQLANRLRDWRDSFARVEYSLVLLVEEPHNDEPLDDSEDDSTEMLWTVRVRASAGTETPIPIFMDTFDKGTQIALEKEHDRLLRIASYLNPRANGQTKLATRNLSAKDRAQALNPELYGQWDVFLDTAELVSMIERDADILRHQGIRVLLPKSWTFAKATATLGTNDTDDIAEGATKSHVGLDKIIAYDWRISLGDTELTEEEMQTLVSSKTGLIQLKDKWVLADSSSVAKVRDYMQELSKATQRRQKLELKELAAEVERLKALNDPRWEERAADLEAATVKYNSEQKDLSGQISVADLRALLLESIPDIPLTVEGTGWYASLLGMRDNAVAPPLEALPHPKTVLASLREYQQRGVEWLYWMSRNNLGAVLADDMGLGKTLQLLTLLAVEHERGESCGPTLVVAPTSVVGNWAAETKRFVPNLRVLTHHGSGRLTADEFIAAVAEADLVVSSYGVISRDVELMKQISWDHVVLDEAQNIKNSTTRAARSVRSITARHRIALTGTPVENRLSEMRSILDFVNPGVLGSASKFRHRFAKPIEREQNEAVLAQLRNLTAPFILRRLKSDPNIIQDLPEKREEILTVLMTDEQAALYQSYVAYVQKQLAERQGISRKGLVLASLTRIKQICNHPAHFLGDGSRVTENGQHRSGKVAALVELMEAAIRRGERVLIFTQYKAFGDILQPYLSTRFGADIPFLHGGVSKSGRDAMVDKFQSLEGAPAMILSLKAGGTGLNLTAANVVVHMDRWWNPAVENQATDRAFRIGQEKDVHVYKMITQGTMEESIQEILEGKTVLAGAVVREGEGWITELNPEQLAELMSYTGDELDV
ncbi:DEAD/DEAH box helicase [Corynebacterium caspium]|uniref:DEAD/DEAH box helicase n=1 Tax=Corynebacterium caspium TaxID=234828 RepID=UPI00036B391A|nr:DEAD/DEAH box helicase [Corynebacterium caspium]WKD59485.1 ATP-dependent helicase HepA [Corynebacterium caspium DSM 44850]